MGAGGSSSFLGLEGGSHFLCRACRRTFVTNQGTGARSPPHCPHCSGQEVEMLLMSIPQGGGAPQPTGAAAATGFMMGPGPTHTNMGMPFPGGMDRSGQESRIPSGQGPMLINHSARVWRPEPHIFIQQNEPGMLRALPGGGFEPVPHSISGGNQTLIHPQQGATARLATATTLFRLLEEHLRQELQMLQALEASENAAPQTRPAGMKMVAEIEAQEKAFSELSEKAASTDCTVCLESFGPEDLVVAMPCNHVYHRPCLTPWLQQQNTCPDCRHEIRDQATETREELTGLSISELRYQLTEAGLDHSSCIEKSDLVDMLQGHVDRERIINREQNAGAENASSPRQNESQAIPPEVEAL